MYPQKIFGSSSDKEAHWPGLSGSFPAIIQGNSCVIELVNPTAPESTSSDKSKPKKLSLPSPTQFNTSISDTNLQFGEGNTTVKRPGGASSYPAAFADVPAAHSSFTVFLVEAFIKSNSLSFGVAKKGSPSKSGSDGMGQYFGSMAVDTTVSRLDAIPVSTRRSVFMGATSF